jgi:hypothetical protein
MSLNFEGLLKYNSPFLKFSKELSVIFMYL